MSLFCNKKVIQPCAFTGSAHERPLVCAYGNGRHNRSAHHFDDGLQEGVRGRPVEDSCHKEPHSQVEVRERKEWRMPTRQLRYLWRMQVSWWVLSIKLSKCVSTLYYTTPTPWVERRSGGTASVSGVMCSSWRLYNLCMMWRNRLDAAIHRNRRKVYCFARLGQPSLGSLNTCMLQP